MTRALQKYAWLRAKRTLAPPHRAAIYHERYGQTLSLCAPVISVTTQTSVRSDERKLWRAQTLMGATSDERNLALAQALMGVHSDERKL